MNSEPQIQENHVQNPLKESIAERFGLVSLYDTVLKRRVPETPWYMGDGAALTLLLTVQVVTGITMTLVYNNAAGSAYQSVQYITNQLPLGWMVRGIHYWSASIMVIVLFIHVARHLVIGGYKTPREGTWTVGVFLFFLVFTMAFTGYVLRWDMESIYAVRIVLNALHRVPFIGDQLVYLLQGDSRMGLLTLTRFFSVHIWIVPLLLLSLVMYHLYLVIIHGVSHREEWFTEIESVREHKIIYKKVAETEEKGEWFYPDTVFYNSVYSFVVFGAVLMMVLVMGAPELFPRANLVEREIPAEEWWFGWYSALIALVPPWAAPFFQIVFPLVIFAVMLLIPVLDRSVKRGAHNRPFWVIIVIISTIGLIWLSDLRRRSPWTGGPDRDPPPVPAGFDLTSDVETGRQLFAQHGCNSCHAVASHGRDVGPDLARIKHRLSPTELYNYILEPPEDVAMPSYRGQISDADLNNVVSFVLVAQTFTRY
jgi:ubiquinol-cytochrome c reductase cytochrome b subunit